MLFDLVLKFMDASETGMCDINEEKEIKIILTKDEYQKLDGIFDWSKDYIRIGNKRFKYNCFS